jgi:hypothetical protein
MEGEIMTEERVPYGGGKDILECHKYHPVVQEYKERLEKSCLLTGFPDWRATITRNVIIVDCFVNHFLPEAGWKIVKIEDVDLGTPRNLLIKDRESKE